MKVLSGLLAVCVSASICAAAGAATDTGTFDLIFRAGTLDDLPRATVIEYAQTGTKPGEQDDVAIDQTIRLSIGSNDQTALERFQEGKTGTIGSFKTAVGNPVVMYFMEDTVREVAELSGGSPFYIRNRFKEALVEDASVEPVMVFYRGGEVAAKRVVLHPLEGDAHAKQAGFDDIALEFVMSEAVPGWYYTLVATGGEAKAGFESRIALEGVVGSEK